MSDTLAPPSTSYDIEATISFEGGRPSLDVAELNIPGLGPVTLSGKVVPGVVLLLGLGYLTILLYRAMNCP